MYILSLFFLKVTILFFSLLKTEISLIIKEIDSLEGEILLSKRTQLAITIPFGVISFAGLIIWALIVAWVWNYGTSYHDLVYVINIVLFFTAPVLIAGYIYGFFALNIPKTLTAMLLLFAIPFVALVFANGNNYLILMPAIVISSFICYDAFKLGRFLARRKWKEYSESKKIEHLDSKLYQKIAIRTSIIGGALLVILIALIILMFTISDWFAWIIYGVLLVSIVLLIVAFDSIVKIVRFKRQMLDSS